MFEGLRVARLRAIFRIPKPFNNVLFGPHVTPPEHLAYIEWYTPPNRKDADSNMYIVSRSRLANGQPDSAVIELSSIVRCCQLCPRFGAEVSRSWTSATVLDQCNHYYINNFVNHSTYQTIY